MGIRKSKDVWKNVYQKSVQDASATQQALMKHIEDGKINPGNSKEVEQFVSQTYAAFAAKNRGHLRQLWRRYVKNPQAGLSQAEAQELTRDSLINMKAFLPDLLRDATTEASKTAKIVLQRTVIKYEQELHDEDVLKMEEKMKEVLRQTGVHTLKQIDDMLEMQMELADSMWKKMDANSDGRVTEDEFIENFARASDELLDPRLSMSWLHGINDLDVNGNQIVSQSSPYSVLDDELSTSGKLSGPSVAEEQTSPMASPRDQGPTAAVYHLPGGTQSDKDGN
jgi:hypothetical protein